jgi:hypothetical protein
MQGMIEPEGYFQYDINRMIPKKLCLEGHTYDRDRETDEVIIRYI